LQIILDNQKIQTLLDDIVSSIMAELGPNDPVALIGIRSRGAAMAQRLVKLLADQGFSDVDLGTLDITLYRDDLNQKGLDQPKIRGTEIDFDIDNHFVILVDDVLWTGRTIRAALDALIDWGRPRVIRLAVLIDRGGRELPISADYVGKIIEPPVDKKVRVRLREMDEQDVVGLV